MTLATQIATDIDATYNTTEFAESLTYTPTGGIASTVTAFVDRDSVHQEPYVRGEDMAYCTVRVRLSDVANPQQGDRFTIDSGTWEVAPDGVSVATRVGGAVYEWDIECVREETG